MNDIKKSTYVTASYWAVIGSTITVITLFTLYRSFGHSDWKDMVVALPYFLLYGTVVWAIFVLPFVSQAPRHRFVSGVGLAWLSGAVVASLGFVTVSLVFWQVSGFEGVPFIATIGALAGLSFSLYIRWRSKRATNG